MYEHFSSPVQSAGRAFVICQYQFFNHIALRMAKIVYNFGLSECKRVNVMGKMLSGQRSDLRNVFL